MTRQEIREIASRRMEERRSQALEQAERRRGEIETKLPHVAEMRRMQALTASELTANMLSNASPAEKQANFEKIRKNNLECSALITKAITDAGYPADYDKVKYRCELCNDTGYTLYGMCDCFRRLISRVAADELNRTANMPNADFGHFDVELYRGVSKNGTDAYKTMKKVLANCIAYADSFDPKSSESLLFIGSPGLGKTHLSIAIARKVIEKGYSVVYGSLLDRLRAIEDEHFGRAQGDTLSILLDADLLILDDLGTEPSGQFYESTLYNIINTRINTGKPVIISTNLSVAQLSSTYNERLISRMMFAYKTVAFVGDDIRRKMR